MNQPLKKYADVEWTDEIDALIGTVPDAVVSERFGIATRSVRTRRIRLKKSSAVLHSTKAPKWSKKIDKLIGTMHDSELAKKLGTTKYHVRTRRLELGIPAYVPAPVPESQLPKKFKLVITEAQKRKLGQVSDAVLAERWGFSAGAVTRLRNSLGIEPIKQCAQIEWTSGMLNLLGEVSDNAVAREYEVSPASVKIKRIEMGILPFGKKQMDAEPELPSHVIPLVGVMPDKQISDRYKINRLKLRVYRALNKIPEAEYHPPAMHDWSAQDEALLGTMSDSNVARRLNITPGQVHHHRVKLGIAPFDRQAEMRWTAERLAQLGQDPDHLLARKWGWPQTAVRAKREELGIAPCPQNVRQWTQQELAKLGTMSDPELARSMGISPTAVANQRRKLKIPPFTTAGPYKWKPKDLKRLGRVPDDELAAELGVSYQFVAQKRIDLGIAVLRRSDLRWTQAVIQKMGVESDAKIAAELGCSAGLVQQKRTQLQIPPIEASAPGKAAREQGKKKGRTSRSKKAKPN